MEHTFKIIEFKYKTIKKQQELIADKLVEDGECDEQQLLANRNVGESLNNQCLNISKQFAAYLKKSFPPVVFNNTTPDSLTAMTSLVSKMADVLQSIKSSSSGLERLSVPKTDSKFLTRYATQIASFVNDMEDNDCHVTSLSVGPFFYVPTFFEARSKG